MHQSHSIGFSRQSPWNPITIFSRTFSPVAGPPHHGRVINWDRVSSDSQETHLSETRPVLSSGES